MEEAKVLVNIQLSEVFEIEPTFPTKKKRKKQEIPDDGIGQFRMSVNQMLDSFISHLNWRYTKLREIYSDFGFLFQMSQLSSAELKKAASELAVKYSTDLDAFELSCEMESLKAVTKGMELNLKTARPLELLQFMYDYSLSEAYPNIVVAVRIFLTLPVTVASCERSFSKLKLVKTYLRSTMGQERLSNLALLSIANRIGKEVEFDGVIDKFASIKAIKIDLK